MNKKSIELTKQVEKLYNTIMEKPLRILEMFNEFFGEERVEMQGYYTLEALENWLTITPIYGFIPNGETLGIDSDTWNRCYSKRLPALPIEYKEKVINALSKSEVRTKIINTLYNNIFILVHFPEVRITNEYDKFVDINDLWAKVGIFSNGSARGSFTLNRSTYQLLHFISGYMHSHISVIPKNDFSAFQSPCLGTGPIRTTIASLNREFDDDLWNMFCLELSKYVTVESVSGTPYHRLENLGSHSLVNFEDKFFTYLYCSSNPIGSKLTDFIRHFVGLKKLKFNYVNGSYSIGMSFVDYIVLISNEFIAWYNDQYNKHNVFTTFNQLKRTGFIKECVIDNGKIYYERSLESINTCSQYIGKKVCTFKGKDITVAITDVQEIVDNNRSNILNVQNALWILNIILKVLNYRYGRNKTVTEDSDSGTEVRYL